MTFSASWQESSRTERIAFVAVAAASCLSLFFSIAGYPAVGHDSDVHLNWLEQFSRLFYHGVSYPRWLTDSNGGFGSPTFYFYPPLPYWIASFFRLLLPFIPTPFFNLIMLVATLGSFATVRLLLKQYSSRQIAILTASLAYAFIAYRFADVFVRDALGEHWAMMFLPLVFLRMKERVQQVALLSIAWSGLLLCNIPIAILAAASIAVRFLVERSARDLVDHGLAFIISVLVAAIYILPSAMLRKYLHTEHLYDITFQTTGFSLLDLFQHRGWLRFLASITLAAGAAALIRQRNAHRGWWWIAFVCVVLQIPIYAPLWHPRYASFVQFTWRFDAILLLAIAVMYVLTIDRWQHYTMIALAVVTIFGGVRLSNEFVLHRALAFDRYRIDAPEYHPIWIPNDTTEVKAVAQLRIDEAPAMILGLTMPGDYIRLLSRTATAYRFNIHLSERAPVRFHLFYWPYWKLSCNGEPIHVQADPNGFATAYLPVGEYPLLLTLTESRAEIFGKYLSVFGLICLLGLVSTAAYREMSTRFDRTSSPTETRKI